MKDLINKLKEVESDFNKGIYTTSEYHNIIFELSKTLNKTGVKL